MTSRHTCSVTAAPRLATVHGKTYQENKHTELAALADAVVSYAEERVRIEPPLALHARRRQPSRYWALKRPRFVRHRIECYAASAAGGSWFCRTAAGV